MRRRLCLIGFAALILLSSLEPARAGDLNVLCALSPIDFDPGRPCVETAFDGVARLTASQKYGAALEALQDSPDSLRKGIIACYAESYVQAAEFLKCGTDNPFLEWFRLYYRALSLRKLDRFREAATDIDSLFACRETARFWKRGNAYANARELQIDVTANTGSLSEIMELLSGVDPLSPRESLILSRELADRGQDSLAAFHFASQASYLFQERDKELLAGLCGTLERFYPRMSADDLRRLARTAIRSDLDGESEKIIGQLLERDGDDCETLLLKGMLLSKRGKSEEAITLFDEIAGSSACAAMEADAIGRSASLDYKLGNLERAVERYRTLATEHGQWWSFDLGARIDVALGKYDEALDLWKQHAAEHRAGNDRVDITPGVAIDQASLLNFLGRNGEAYEILKNAPFKGGGSGGCEPSAFYWLARTSPSDSERVHWSTLLSGKYPNSYYAFALARDIDSLIARSDPGSSRSRLEVMLDDERSLIDSLSSLVEALGDRPAHPAVQAYTYFIDRGLLAEAGQMIVTLNKGYEIDKAQAIALYVSTRVRGYCDLAIWIVSRAFSTAFPGELKERLLHPVPFADILSNAEATHGLPPELILAVMYAESKFAMAAVSSAGASGVMQLMPSTARWIARKHNLDGDCAENLFDPECNIRIGSQYLAYLLRRSDGSLIAALAAYNAGEGAMARWRRNFDPPRDPMVALEMIGQMETGEYVKDVLEALCFYRALAGEKARQ